ncbi:MAG: hypothetical protein QOE54_7049 [Streptosporangiaceae bacterium]|jgi:signal transduction histidine kinase|nr:hypothetical protein [Streptosporangiaceae bacterium]MDX6434683.1 hypothetical protein [Streptosporangiaceae bacterium]
MQGDPPTERGQTQQHRFTADASHELRTPLAGLRAQLEEARLHPDETDLLRLLDAALHDVDRLEAITADLLLLVQIAVGTCAQRQPVDLTALVRDHATRCTDGADIRLEAVSGVTVNAAPTHLGRLVSNLLDNARRHARHSIQMQVRRHDTTAELIIADDGPGIPAQDHERVFERFARVDTARCRRNGGTGLGLAIARDIAQAHDGTLHVQDVPGGGACFVLRLPLVPPT